MSGPTPAPPLPAEVLLHLLLSMLVLLALARLLGSLAERAGQPAVVGERDHRRDDRPWGGDRSERGGS